MADVVTIEDRGQGVVEITMRDRMNKNTFSPELICGLKSGFEKVSTQNDSKIVVLTGYDTYFASGGTQESLLSLYEGKAKFTDGNFYSLPLECCIPVIAAMQGHGIGGGFVFGLFSDFVVLSRESVYTTNFMKYGFTPGMGATCLLPAKLGLSLAQEMLIGARNFRGADLEKRGIPFPVVSRIEVLPLALELAREIADKPRLSLVTLKSHLVANLKDQLPVAITQELSMHEKTFHQPEVKDRIHTLFGK